MSSPCHLNFDWGEALKRSAINPSLSATLIEGARWQGDTLARGDDGRDVVAPLPICKLYTSPFQRVP